MNTKIIALYSLIALIAFTVTSYAKLCVLTYFFLYQEPKNDKSGAPGMFVATVTIVMAAIALIV